MTWTYLGEAILGFETLERETRREIDDGSVPRSLTSESKREKFHYS